MPRLSKIGAAALAAFGWTGLQSVTASYLVVAGGGGGGYSDGGGGGAGGLLTGTTTLNTTLSYTVTVGAGGIGAKSGIPYSANGSNSVFNSITATGGGHGGGGGLDAAGNGGSGGGGGTDGVTVVSGGTGTSGQGNNGGASGGGIGGYPAGGGGGAGSVGSNASSNQGGAGGNGSASSITGTSVTYAGGGGGGGSTGGGGSSPGAGGTGGGGAGGVSGAATAGTANLGGGGGGGGPSGAQGGSGVVIISYAAPQKFGGGVVTASGGNIIHTFNTSGTLSPLSSLSASYLIVAGGGGGGNSVGGGGGAGGLLSGSNLTIDLNSNYLVTVGSGGSGATGLQLVRGSNGSDSLFSMVTTTVSGGGGGATAGVSLNGLSGGSGGGASSTSGAAGTAGTGVSGQGYAGGSASASTSAGGGGGSSSVGGTPTASVSGSGGSSTSNSISGTSTAYAGGGGGGAYQSGVTAGAGGGGGATAGSVGTANASNATANTGSGGGGGGYQNTPSAVAGNGGNGGSGVVIISYAGSTQQMAGGIVTITGGNVIHTFTNSGYLAPLKLVNNSLRFRNSGSTYLNRTSPTTSTNTVWTFSAWFKRGKLSTDFTLVGAASASNSYDDFYFNTSDNLTMFEVTAGSIIWQFTTSQVFRDPAAWYHLVFAYDSTQSTSTNRVKIYINGLQVTAFSTATYPSLNATSYINSSSASLGQFIGRFAGSAVQYFDGYMTEINMVTGQQLTPNSFGTFNSYGVWQPITYGGSYGTNGFYLPFKTNGLNYTGLFNGSSQYLTVANNVAFEFGTGSFTIECWFCTATKTNYQCLIGQYATGSTGWYIETDSNGYAHFGMSGAVQVQGTINVCDGQWHHIAAVRNGSSSTTLYIDGVANATGTVTDTGAAAGAPLGISYLGGGYTRYVNGNISNVRIVKGTAVYTSNFKVPTSNLTAISGTSLLTLQNATIVDNSSNAFTITNNGSVTTPQNYPFSAANMFYDQGPAGNNWTPNNISGISGTTLDYMTDVPTLTSATVSNFCVLNPLDYNSGTVSNGNLQWASSSSLGYGCFSTFAFDIADTTNKYYWEMTLTSGDAVFGIAPLVLSPSNTSRTGSYGYYTSGSKYSGTTPTAYGSTFTAGDVISVSVGAGVITFYKNGTSQGSAFTGLTGFFKPATWEVTTTVNANFGQQPFKYTPPSGFIALNAYNL